ncbi:OstA-like protein [Flavobacterium gelidilacus]|uniref:OstA-like protein n=1 Tax=Flavobacterium gelidilacus TaxID=206041 RepID=UPI00041BA144|nr:OstA-like protein [Flavobacterium gelidilacus]
MKNYIYIFLLFILTSNSLFAQNETNNSGKIVIEYSDFIDKNQNEIPGAIVFTGNVRVLHNGVKISCNKAYHFTAENYVKAFGNVQLVQGDTIFMNSRYAEYNGDKEFAFATGDVNMRSPDSNLVTDTVYFDRKSQQAFYNSYGTITNKDNILKSKSGRYYLDEKKYSFKTAVSVVNPRSTIKTNHLDYYDNSGHAYVYGPSTITSKTDYIYTENGFYDTTNDIGKLKKNSHILYNSRRIEGDDIFYDRKKNFSKLVNNVKITDTVNNLVAKGHYAEVYRNTLTKNDSMFITKKALIITKTENDSMYMHGKRILVTGPPENRIIRAYNNVRFFNLDMSGKCDSLHSSNKNALTKMIGKPILWSNKSQMTGDIMHIIGNNESEKVDSLKVLNNAFLIQKDTLSENGYNQVKGQNLYGKFRENKLYEVDIVKNCEAISYLYNEEDELVGINKSVCSRINLELVENKIETITFFNKTDGYIYPEEEFPENARRLRGFLWRGDEEIKSKEDIFPQDELDLDEKIQTETKAKELIEDKPMEILKETLEFDKKKPKKKK